MRRFLSSFFSRQQDVNSTVTAETDAERLEFIEEAFKALLGRSPDEEGVQVYKRHLDSGKSYASVIAAITAGQEYKNKEAEKHQALALQNWDFENDPQLKPYITDEFIDFSAELEQCSHLPREQFETLWREIFAGDRELVIGQREYAVQHKQRFWELFNAVAMLLERKKASGRIKILEIGVSEFSGFYKSLWPEVELHTADRPHNENYIGFTSGACQRISACSHHFEIDLNSPESLAEEFRPEAMADYDIIVFAEVLEHLVVNPVELLAGLVSLLKSSGQLYLTTPNFFSWRKMQMIARRENPQQVYPAGDDNWDAHFHHREFSVKELLSQVQQAGGCCRAFYFSDCWDDDEQAPRPLPIVERSNLVMVIESNKDAANNQQTHSIFPSQIAAIDSGALSTPEATPRPVMMNVETVNSCTLDCIFCAYGSMQRPKETMSLELFEKAIGDYSDMGGGQLSLTPVVGEIFTDRFLEERLLLIEKYKNITGVSITTNAVGLRRFKDQKLENILDRLNRVHISIYGIDAEEHRLISQKDTFQIFLEGFKRLADMVGDSDRLWVNFRLLKKREQSELDAWLQNEIGFVPTNFHTIEYAKWSGHEEAPVTLPLDATWVNRAPLDSFCVIPAVAGQVHVNGNVSICHCDDYECDPDLSLGDINKATLLELFSSEKYREFWQLRGETMPDFCKGCGFFSLIEDGKKFEQAVADPLSFIGG